MWSNKVLDWNKTLDLSVRKVCRMKQSFCGKQRRQRGWNDFSTSSYYTRSRRTVKLYFETRESKMTFLLSTMYPSALVIIQGRIQDFFRRGCTRSLLYFNTNKPHSYFFLQNTSCIRKPQVISGRGGWGGAHPLHPPPRSAPVISLLLSLDDTFKAISRLFELT